MNTLVKFPSMTIPEDSSCILSYATIKRHMNPAKVRKQTLYMKTVEKWKIICLEALCVSL